MAGTIRAGIGGWTFEPWRGVFYPPGLKHAAELEYASRHVTAIEINGTYYSTFKPESWAKWREATPEGFVFTVKASRFCTNRKRLIEAEPSIERFLGQGLSELGDRLGPILWQFMATKKWDPADFADFFAMLPGSQDGVPLRHCIEVRNATFGNPEFVQMCRARGVAICVSENVHYPMIPDVTADFVYARLLKGDDNLPTGYDAAGLDEWAARFKAYAAGGLPADVEPVIPEPPEKRDRDVFAFFIHEGKVRAPAAAQELLRRTG